MMHVTFAATLHNAKLYLHDYLVQFEVSLVTGTIQVLLLGDAWVTGSKLAN